VVLTLGCRAARCARSQAVPFQALGGVPEPYGPAPTWGGVAPGGFSRGPETYWKGAYWQPEEPSPYTNPGELIRGAAAVGADGWARRLLRQRAVVQTDGCWVLWRLTGAVLSAFGVCPAGITRLCAGDVASGGGGGGIERELFAPV